MLCDNDIKEELSYAYIHAIAAAAGCTCDRDSKDRDSIDCTVKAPGLVADDSKLLSPVLGLQLKATVMNKPENDYFAFDLSLKNYNDLRAPRSHPTLLIVYAMPNEKTDWLEHTADGLISRNCAYWCNLKGFPATTNTTSQVVRVPAANRFSPDVLKRMMHKASVFEDIGYAF